MDTQNCIEITEFRAFPLKDSSAVFLCCKNKTILIQTEASFAETAENAMQGKRNARPQTYELLGDVCRGFEIAPEKIIITDLRNGIYFAQITYTMKNELGKKILEIDSRPSDALLQSFLFHVKVFVTPEVFFAAEDATPLFEKIKARESSKNA